MSENLPINVFKYLIKKIPGLHMVETDNRGYIIEFIGEPERYLPAGAEKGKNITDVLPLLTGVIPNEKKSIYLNKIELKPGVVSDIHIINDEDGNYWIIFFDQTAEVDSLRTLIQVMNERELSGKQKRNYPNPFENYYIVDFASFYRTKGNGFKLLEKVPDWIRKHKYFDHKNINIDIFNAFPFLEVFVIEVNDFWESGKNGYLVSETWSEQVGDSFFHLRAFAVNHENKNYLLIKTFNKEGKDEQKLIQAYRDSALAFDKLAKTERKLKELLDYKNKFNSIISHDLRSPIASVLGVMDIILSDKEQLIKLNEIYVELLSDVKDEMTRLMDYNDKLYHWANLELGTFKLSLEEISLKHILKTAYKTSVIACEKKGVKLKMECDEDIVIYVDESLFLQALNNIISNAVKFTKKGNTIFIKGYEDCGKVFVQIEDTGVGMSKKVRDSLFTESSVPSTIGTSGEKGTGLGLDIVKKIADAHKFEIEVKSEIGVGTVFTINIPEFAEVKTG
jgi:signal transduction histidine kinase